jgi:hypothetical protein
LAAWLLSLFALLPSNARADDDRWVLVPVVSGSMARDVSVTQLSSPFEIELRARGQNALSNSDAALLFETRHSSEPVKLNSDEMSKLLKSVGQAARHLALGELPQAQQAMEGVYSLSGPARDYLNREAARARKIFDTCLMTGYLWERDQKHAQALRQMVECARNFPGFRPEMRAYPPELRAVFEQAKQQVNQMPATTLLVQGRQSAGCGVRLNGIEIGKSPMSFSDVRAGVTRVQLECEPGVAGRIHSIELKPGENRLDIDPVFDASVHSHGGLWLQYGNESERKARADLDVAQIQRALGTGHVLALWVEGASTYPRVHLRQLTRDKGKPHTQEIATLSYTIGEGYSPEGVAAAIKKLMPAQRERLAPPPAAAIAEESGPIDLDNVEARAPAPPPTAAEPAAPKPAPNWNDQDLVWGLILGAAGVGGMVAGWVFYGMRANFNNTYAKAYTSNLAAVGDVEVAATDHPDVLPTLALGGAGSLLFSFSEYLWLPNSQNVPALAWVFGGLGAAVAITGVALAVFTEHCDGKFTNGAGFSQACLSPTGDVAFAPLLAMHALPLLSIPFSYAIRAATRPDGAIVAFNVGPAPGGGVSLQLHGAF